jgi:uncharacterized protein
LRTSMVLGRDDSVFPRLRNLVKLGMGGHQGNGEQYVSWVHEHDVARATEWVSDHHELEGAVNCTAPGPIKNVEFMRVIRKAFGVPFGLPAPKLLLEIASMIIRTETELILKSRWVLPKRLLDSGFVFEFGDAATAIANLAH